MIDILELGQGVKFVWLKLFAIIFLTVANDYYRYKIKF